MISVKIALVVIGLAVVWMICCEISHRRWLKRERQQMQSAARRWS